MQVALTPKKETFQSFDITITVESEEEAAQLYALVNHSTICSLLPQIADSRIREVIETALGRWPQYEKWHILLDKYTQGTTKITKEDKEVAHAKIDSKR